MEKIDGNQKSTAVYILVSVGILLLLWFLFFAPSPEGYSKCEEAARDKDLLWCMEELAEQNRKCVNAINSAFEILDYYTDTTDFYDMQASIDEVMDILDGACSEIYCQEKFGVY